MLAFETSNGKYGVPLEEFDILQQKNLKSIKYDGKQIKDFGSLSVYDKKVRFKNVFRENADGTCDVVISASAVDEIPTGFLPKRAYKAIRFKKNTPKLLPTSGYTDFSLITVTSTDIISQFNQSLPVDDVEELLVAALKKGVSYFG